jgi:hypothetical protein
MFKDEGKASFPALLLDDGRVVNWRNSADEWRPTDRHPRGEEMRALIEEASDDQQH